MAKKKKTSRSRSIGKKIIIDYDDFVYPTISKYGLQKLKSFIIYKLANIYSNQMRALNCINQKQGLLLFFTQNNVNALALKTFREI